MIKKFFQAQSTSIFRYIFEQLLFLFFSWIPSILGIILRAIFYKLILKTNGFPVIEKRVIIKCSKYINLGKMVFIDSDVYLHSCPGGIFINDFTRIMHGAELNVYNFRGLKNSRISIGKNSVIGPYCILTGQFGLEIGDNVLLAPHVSILPSNHYYKDKQNDIINQGIYGNGIKIHNNVWIGANSVILDGVAINEGSVIAAGAVVKDDVPPFSLVVGVPAVVKKRW